MNGLAQLAAAGVHLPPLTARLLDDGVAAFAASMRELLAGFHSPPPVHAQQRSIR